MSLHCTDKCLTTLCSNKFLSQIRVVSIIIYLISTVMLVARLTKLSLNFAQPKAQSKLL